MVDMVLDIWKAFHLPAPFHCREMIENENISSRFLKTIQYNIRPQNILDDL